jgi:hypothetical protein
MRYSCNLPELHPRVHHDPRSRTQTGTSASSLPSPSCRPASLRRSSMAPRLRTLRSPCQGRAPFVGRAGGEDWTLIVRRLMQASSVTATLLLEVNTRSKKSESPSAMPTSHPKGTPRTGLCQQSNRSAARRNGNWKMAPRDPRPPRKDRKAKNRRSETGARQPNPRECRGFSQTGK